MNNEIKEKIKAYYLGDDIDKVLDDITNLQEELEEEKRIEQEDFKTIQNLEEENERLKLEKETIKRWYNLCKSRNEKAIRTLETLKGSARWERYLYEVDYLLNILNGDENE